MNIAIVINTYKKIDNSTYDCLAKTLHSVANQTYQEYTVYLIGDNYDDNDEFTLLATSIIPSNKIYYENLPVAVERTKYPAGSQLLWSAGGVNSRNEGYHRAIQHKHEYICNLDHDDIWHPQHLELIVHTIETTNNPAFIYSCGTYFNSYLPYVPLTNEIIISNPQPGKTIHSSTCINVNKIPLLYRDVYQETGMIEPADADMWTRVSNYIIDNELTSFLITSITCYHLTENQ
jgi:glycosyltransferase involved in cell wall biosynthesis